MTLLFPALVLVFSGNGSLALIYYLSASASASVSRIMSTCKNGTLLSSKKINACKMTNIIIFKNSPTVMVLSS